MSSAPEPVPDWADLMTLQEFVDAVSCGFFIDDDGIGRYVRDGLMYGDVRPSDIRSGPTVVEFTHVAWFNK